MKSMIFMALLALSLSNTDPMKIGKINKAKSEARDAFNSGDYKAAIAKFKYLVDSMSVNEDELKLNLAHSYYLDKDTANAFSTYQHLTSSGDKQISSKANQQLGVMSNARGKSEEALDHFKRALKENPQNEDARYNYEMLKKKLDQKKKQEEEQKKNDPNQNKKPDPSEYAKRLKAQADQLVAVRRYSEALQLMTDGLKKDPTVSHYDDYIKRIEDIVKINK